MKESLISSSSLSFSKLARTKNNNISSFIESDPIDLQNSNSLRRPMLEHNNRNKSPIRTRDILNSDSSDEAENKSPSISQEISQNQVQQEQLHRRQFQESLGRLTISKSIKNEDKYSHYINNDNQTINNKKLSLTQKSTDNNSTLCKSNSQEISPTVKLEAERKAKAHTKLSTIQSSRHINSADPNNNNTHGISSSAASSLPPSSSSDSDSSDNEDDHYESLKVQMHPLSKKSILCYSSSLRQQDQSLGELTEVKIPKDPIIQISPEPSQPQSRNTIISPTRISSPLQKSGRYFWNLKLSMVAKIKVIFGRLGKGTLTHRAKSLNSHYLDLIGDLSIMKESDEKELKAQQKLIHRLLNSYLAFPTFNPYSIYKMTWDMLMLLLMVYLFFAIPLILSFGVDFSDLFGQFPYFTLSLLLITDALVNANTGFYRNGALIVSKYMVFRNYAKKILFIDVFGITPLLVYTLYPSTTSKLFLFLYLVKYKSITKIFKRIELRLDIKTSLLNKIALLKLLFAVLFIAHLFANFWIILPQFNTQDNWFRKADVHEESWYIQYVTAYYYITVTMVTVGYGDITPSNHLETFFSIITILLSCAVFAYSVNSIGFILEEINREQKNLNKNMQVINSYMDQKNISRELRYQIREYLEFFWREQNAGNVEQEQQIITQLAHNLKQKLFVEANKLILKDNKIFSGRFSERVLMKALTIVKEYKFTPQQVIIEKNQFDDCAIYFIENGNVQIFFENEKTSKILPIQTLSKGSYFGEIGFYTGQERSMSVKSLGFATLLKIDREDFLGILKQFPKDEELFHLIKDQLIFCQNYGQNGTNCYACNSGTHLVSSCPMVKYAPNKIFCYGRYNYNPGQSREQWKRSKRIKCPTLKDIELVQEAVENIQDNYPEMIEETESSETDGTSSQDYLDSINGQPEGSTEFQNENEEQEVDNSKNDNNSYLRSSNQQQMYPKSSFYNNNSQQNDQISQFAMENQNGYSSILHDNSIINEINEDSGESDSQQDTKRLTRRKSTSSQESSSIISELKEPPNLLQTKNNKLKRACQIELNNSFLDKLALSSSNSRSRRNSELSTQKINKVSDIFNKRVSNVLRSPQSDDNNEGTNGFKEDEQSKERGFTFDRTSFGSVKQNSHCNPNCDSNFAYCGDQNNLEAESDHILNQPTLQAHQKGSFGCMGMLQSKHQKLLQQYNLQQNCGSEPSFSQMSQPQQLIPLTGYNSSFTTTRTSSPWLHSDTPKFFARSRTSLATNGFGSPRNSGQLAHNSISRQSCFCYGAPNTSKLQCQNNLKDICNARNSSKHCNSSNYISNNQGSVISPNAGFKNPGRRHESIFLPGNSQMNSGVLNSFFHKKYSLNNSRKSSQNFNIDSHNNVLLPANIDQMQKKITAIYDKLITESPSESLIESLDFDKQQDFMIYFPSGNLTAVLTKKKIPKRSPNRAAKLTHFFLNSSSRNPSSSFNYINPSEDMKLSKTPSNQLLQIKQMSPHTPAQQVGNVCSRPHSSLNVSPRQRSQLQKKLNTLIIPQKMSSDSFNQDTQIPSPLTLQLQQSNSQYAQQNAKRSSSIFRPRESLEISTSTSPKKRFS